MQHDSSKPAGLAAPCPAADFTELFDALSDLADVLFDFLDVINLIIETLLNWGDYLNGE